MHCALLIFIMLHVLRPSKSFYRSWRSNRMRDTAYRRFSMCDYVSVANGKEIDLSHLLVPNSRIDPYWIDKLGKLRGSHKEVTIQSLIKQLTPLNNLGYMKNGKTVAEKGTFVEFATLQKNVHKDKIILLRSGEFYETYGIDAIMLVALCGLNSMAGKCKAGCPVKNVQQTLDDLTKHGLSVAVYEEIAEPEMNPGPAAKVSKRKNRALSRIITPASKTYPYGLCLMSEDIPFSQNKPYVGILGTVSGYNLYEIRVDEQCVVQSSRLTDKAVDSFLRSNGFAEPVYVQQARNIYGSLQGGDFEELSGYTQDDFPDIVLRRVFAQNALNENDLDKFRFVTHQASGRPRCIYQSTQQQIGLVSNPNVPDLIQYLLPTSHAAHSARFLRKWLSTPPPYTIADQMQQLSKRLLESSIPLPTTCSPYMVGKIITLLNARQCNSAMFKEVLACTSAVRLMLSPNLIKSDTGHDTFEPLIEPLLALTSFETGVPADRSQLLNGCLAVEGMIREVVQDEKEIDPISFVSYSRLDSGHHLPFPYEFFEINEREFRGRVKPTHPLLKGIYEEICQAANAVLKAIDHDYPLKLKDSSFNHDKDNNLICLGSKPSSADARKGVEYIHPVDRKGQLLSKRYTTKLVTDALHHYRELCSDAPRKVERVLQTLCGDLSTEHITIIHVANWAMILQAANAHVASSLQRGWSIPTMLPLSDDRNCENVLDLEGLSAYWMNRIDSKTKTNSFKLRGVFLLTAPNMSGKSTLMRSTLVAALLANSGLFVPCSRAVVPRYDSFYLRTASYDVPSEEKSAFAMEMDDMAVVMRDSTQRSLVMIDEVGKGTSSMEGSVLAGAILESLAARNVSGIFATHLHELFEIPGLQVEGVTLKKMDTTWFATVNESRSVVIENKFTLTDGICTYSLAIETAKLVGGQSLQDVCNRATVLYEGLVEQEKQYKMKLEMLERDNEILRSALATSQASNFTHQSLALNNSSILVEGAKSRMEKESLSNKRIIEMPAAAVKIAEPVYNPLDELALIMKSVGVTRDDALIIDESFEPPANFEGNSCVYVLVVQKGTQPPFLYIGETESITSRLKTHRIETFRNHTVRALISKTPNKGAARLSETQLIQAFKGLGYDIRADRDGTHVRFGGQTKMI